MPHLFPCESQTHNIGNRTVPPADYDCAVVSMTRRIKLCADCARVIRQRGNMMSSKIIDPCARCGHGPNKHDPDNDGSCGHYNSWYKKYCVCTGYVAPAPEQKEAVT